MKYPTALPITVLGAGAWGTALAIALADRHNVVLWGRNHATMQEMSNNRDNLTYLPGFPFPQNLVVTSELEVAVDHVLHDPQQGLLITATAIVGLRPLLRQLTRYPIDNIIWLCKGFEEGTCLLPHQIVRETLGDPIRAGALSGPSFAQEVARGLPCALTLASESAGLRERAVAAIHGQTIRVYSTDDLTGVEVGGAVKNILAIATGIVDGMGLGLNARAALITRGLAEITRLGVALGGRSETFMGLTGVGDLILTCTGDLSRNRKVGLSLAQGKKLDVIIAELGHIAEGVRCAQAVRALAAQHRVDMPIANAVASVLFDNVSPQDMIAKLLARDPRQETA